MKCSIREIKPIKIWFASSFLLFYVIFLAAGAGDGGGNEGKVNGFHSTAFGFFFFSRFSCQPRTMEALYRFVPPSSLLCFSQWKERKKEGKKRKKKG